MDINQFLLSFEYIGLFLLIFSDALPLLSFFFPGGSVLLIAGVLASKGILNIYLVCIISFIASMLGDALAYFLGKKLGIKLFTRENSILFNKKHLASAQHMYEKYGALIILVYHYVPFLRNFASIVAGIGHMNFMSFMLFNFIGAAVWVLGSVYGGYYIGKLLPHSDTTVYAIIFVGILVLSIPSYVYVFKKWRKGKENRIVNEESDSI